jgi:glutaredoxin 3
VDYRNVKASQSALQEMLGHTGGRRQVPVLVEDGRVVVGFGGT